MSAYTVDRKTHQTSAGHKTAHMMLVLLGSVVFVVVASGCTKPLLSPNEPRSQYSRYDLVRGRFAPQYIEDEFGRKMPNLRGRLLMVE